MKKYVIEVDGIGKKYRVGAQRTKHQTIREKLHQAISTVVGRVTGKTEDALFGSETFWALQDISFKVEQGEVLGLIGSNGAGKSTLLKILARITPPTTGEAVLKGRVGSLLEVSTGFHTELTGRENIFFSGAVLGMNKEDILRKFDEIVAFSGIETFIDTPVKRYSSGMLVRLGFAVAAHLEPEILLVDEVLAVGDAEFQKKCLGKMSDVASGGRTVVFVSHNMSVVNSLCSRCILLNKGRVQFDGITREATSLYYGGGIEGTAQNSWLKEDAPGDDSVKLYRVKVYDSNQKVSDSIDIRESITVEMEYEVFEAGVDLVAFYIFKDGNDNVLFTSPDWHEKNWGAKKRDAGIYKTQCVIPGNTFAEGSISVIAEVSTRSPDYTGHFLERDAVVFYVVDTGDNDSVRSGWSRKIPGVMRPMLNWETTLTTDVKG